MNVKFGNLLVSDSLFFLNISEDKRNFQESCVTDNVTLNFRKRFFSINIHFYKFLQCNETFAPGVLPAIYLFDDKYSTKVFSEFLFGKK